MDYSTDDIVQKKTDLNHITKMSYQMHVPDSIIVGPNRSTGPRLYQNTEQMPVRMEVPENIRLGLQDQNSTDDESLESTTPPPLPQTSEDDYTSIDTFVHQPIKIADSWHIEPFTEIDDKHVMNNLQTLQNRIQQIERTVARRDFRDRMFYTCIVGYFLLQALLSVRRSMLN